jgi:hypothetical protein
MSNSSLNHLAIAFALSFSAVSFIGAVHASETKEVTKTVTIYSIDDNAALKAKVDAICSDTAVKLSAKAKAACDTHTFPKLTKALAFRNAGIGAEFNTLANQR